MRAAYGPQDMQAVMALRYRCFGTAGGTQDDFDAHADHVVVSINDTDAIVAAFRMSAHAPADLSCSYAAQYYGLDALSQFDGPLLELGRFCIHPDHPDPDILRLAWAGLTAHVDRHAFKMLFGCSSFQGTDPAPYLDAFALLKARYLAPQRWQPAPKAVDVFEYTKQLQNPADLARAQASMPPLLRTYLLMGGWVSDHAVIDHVMGTLHVFTGLEIDAIPQARKRLLRALV